MDPKSLLDELMGKDRDVPLEKRSTKKMRYDDPSVCKYQLGGLCPHRLFKNTRSDLGKIIRRPARPCDMAHLYRWLLFAGPCSYEVHDDHVEWEGIIADYNTHDDREKER